MRGVIFFPLILSLLHVISHSNGDPVGSCPEIDDERLTYLPDSQSCSVFYLCSNGEPIRTYCAEGTEFSVANSLCLYPEDAGCNLQNNDDGEGQTGNDDGESNDDEQEPEGEQNEDTDDASNAVGQCPEEDGELVTILPHASDCERFFICSGGIPYVQLCQPGLLFNPTLLVCDYPESAGCIGKGHEESEAEKEPEEKDEELIEEEEDEDEDEEEGEEEEENDQAAKWVGECPSVDGEYVTILAHATDCTKFFVCNEGTPMVTQCPVGLAFNAEASVCDYLENVNC